MYHEQRLSIVVAGVTERLTRVRVSPMTDNLIPLLEVSGALVRGCLEAACGVLALARTPEWGGIVAVERTAWEMWNELEFVLRAEDPPGEAVKVQVNALLDVIGLLETTTITAPAGMLDRNKEGLARFERAYPELVESVRQQRKNRRMHWSGHSRTAVVGPDPASKAVYKMLSWDTHPDVISIRDISASIENGVATLDFGAERDVPQLVERPCGAASESLLRSWNLFAEFWKQERLVDAPPRKPT